MIGLVSKLIPYKAWIALGAVFAAATVFGAYTAHIRATAKGDILSEIKEINNALANNAIDAREAATRCRADTERMRWDFAAVKCVKRD